MGLIGYQTDINIAHGWCKQSCCRQCCSCLSHFCFCSSPNKTYCWTTLDFGGIRTLFCYGFPTWGWVDVSDTSPEDRFFCTAMPFLTSLHFIGWDKVSHWNQILPIQPFLLPRLAQRSLVSAWQLGNYPALAGILGIQSSVSTLGGPAL